MPKDFVKIIKKLELADNIVRKNQILDEDKDVISFLKSHTDIQAIITTLPVDYEYILKSLMAINQAGTILYNIENTPNHDSLLKDLCQKLLEIDAFYYQIGGIIGYHNTFLKLLKIKQSEKNVNYREPTFTDLRKSNKEVEELVKIGLANLNKFALIAPMGGAGDRLNLFDPKTKDPLPAAKLNFQGRSLIESLIRDIEALEYLYYKTYNKQLVTPIVIMTSDAKNNHSYIQAIFEENNWFKRSKKSFHFIKQLSVPLITQDGHWTLQAPLSLALKPSGHGVLWHLMNQSKAFDFLKSHKREKALIRQINNPIAGVDYLLLSFMGVAMKSDKAFGFISCPRQAKCKEGVNVLREEKQKEGYFYNFSNIEYTDFEKCSLKDVDNKNESKYPSNTNILFADLKEVQKASLITPFPGLTINLKTKVFSKKADGQIVEIKAGRLESMMQNIADSIQDFRKNQINKADQKNLKTYLTISERAKTISTTKNAFVDGHAMSETPQKCFYDVLSNYHDLLTNYCKMRLPPMPTQKEFLFKGPSFLCDIHPMMGPLYSIISKKIIGGNLAYGSDLKLEIAELLLENLELEGSLIIETDLIKNSNKEFYNSASCVLQNVKIKNLGINKDEKNIYWENKISRKEYFKIILGENSQFYAKNVEFINTHEIIVPSNHKMFILRKKDKIIYKTEKI